MFTDADAEGADEVELIDEDDERVTVENEVAVVVGAVASDKVDAVIGRHCESVDGSRLALLLRAEDDGARCKAPRERRTHSRC